MRKAILLALQGYKKVSPNPPVGAVIVQNGRIIGQGYHEEYGGPHAEVNAIENATGDITGSTLYCTLEPCCHDGKRTPPCTKRIINEGIRKVVIGTIDPNEKVNGKGIDELRKAGIEVEYGILQDDCLKLIEKYHHYISEKKPYIAAKIAGTLDGFIADKHKNSKWITNKNARKRVQELRSEFDAVMVGKGTLYKDDPALNLRDIEGEDPYRITIDDDLSVPKNYKILMNRNPEKTIIICKNDLAEEKYREYLSLGVQIVKTGYHDNFLDLQSALTEITRLFPIASILMEGGSILLTEMLKLKMINKMYWFVAPKIMSNGVPVIGDIGIETIETSLKLHIDEIEIIDDQSLFIGYPQYI